MEHNNYLSPPIETTSYHNVGLLLKAHSDLYERGTNSNIVQRTKNAQIKSMNKKSATDNYPKTLKRKKLAPIPNKNNSRKSQKRIKTDHAIVHIEIFEKLRSPRKLIQFKNTNYGDTKEKSKKNIGHWQAQEQIFLLNTIRNNLSEILNWKKIAQSINNKFKVQYALATETPLDDPAKRTPMACKTLYTKKWSKILPKEFFTGETAVKIEIYTQYINISKKVDNRWVLCSHTKREYKAKQTEINDLSSSSIELYCFSKDYTVPIFENEAKPLEDISETETKELPLSKSESDIKTGEKELYSDEHIEDPLLFD